MFLDHPHKGLNLKKNGRLYEAANKQLLRTEGNPWCLLPKWNIRLNKQQVARIPKLHKIHRVIYASDAEGATLLELSAML